MKSPTAAAITDSLLQSLRNCSLNHRLTSSAGSAASPALPGSSSSSTSSSGEPHHHRFDATVELNSHVTLPPFWEQCLDLQTGELYYINCRTGMRVTEDPRQTEEDGDSTDDSEESSSSSSCSHRKRQQKDRNDDVLVVAGCKGCFMYFMVAKQVEDCPKCGGQVLHFDRSGNGLP